MPTLVGRMAIGTNEHPLRVAIVGSGPAGFYAAGHLLKPKSHPGPVVQVDMFDRLPTPWGLVRAGVAPDHPNIKAVSRVYEKTAEHPEFRFYGNVELGRDLTHDDLTSRYHAVVYAVGAQTDRRMGIPGEDLPGSWAATEFVAWYNGHPDYRDLEFDLCAERAVVVGNGNVAMDVARMLALTRDELAADRRRRPRARGARRVDVREIVVLGRRGPAQAAFTNPELLELGEMTDADVFVDPGDVELDPLARRSSRARPPTRPRRRTSRSCRLRRPRAAGKRRRIVLRFLVSPVEILGDRPRRGHPDRATTSLPRTTTARSAPAPPTSPRSSTAGSCSARSATAARRSTACRSTSAAARSRTSGGRDRRRPLPASTRSAGSSAAPPASSAPTSATPRRRSNALLEDLDAGRLPDARRPRPRLARGADRRAPARRRELRRLAGRGPRGARRRRAAWAPAGQAVLVRGAARGREATLRRRA